MIVGMEAGSEEKIRPEILVCQTGSQVWVQIATDFDFNAGDIPVRIRVWGGVRGNRVIVSLLSKVHLDVAAKIPNADKAAFDKAAADAKAGCPVSRVLKAEITMNAKLI